MDKLSRLSVLISSLAHFRKLRRCGAGRPNAQAAWYVSRHLVRWYQRYGFFTQMEYILVGLMLDHPTHGVVAEEAGLFLN